MYHLCTFFLWFSCTKLSFTQSWVRNILDTCSSHPQQLSCDCRQWLGSHQHHHRSGLCLSLSSYPYIYVCLQEIIQRVVKFWSCRIPLRWLLELTIYNFIMPLKMCFKLKNIGLQIQEIKSCVFKMFLGHYILDKKWLKGQNITWTHRTFIFCHQIVTMRWAVRHIITELSLLNDC